jgi:competence protein ComEC
MPFRWWGKVVGLTALFSAALIVVLPRPLEFQKGVLEVEAIDVGQGDALLLITPEGKTLLVDGGGFGGPQRTSGSVNHRSNFDIGEDVVSPVLWARGIRRLNVVALSHAHSDHMDGLHAILRNFHPHELWVGKNPRTDGYQALLSEAAQFGVAVQTHLAGDQLSFGGTQISVLAPDANYQPGTTPSNNDSLVLRVSFRQTAVLLEGDAENPVEQEMVKRGGLKSTLLKVGHHGSLSSTTPEFLAAVAPSVGVISVGRKNHYEHPRLETLQKLQAAHVQTFRTDLHGISCFFLDGTKVDSQPMCK